MMTSPSHGDRFSRRTFLGLGAVGLAGLSRLSAAGAADKPAAAKGPLAGLPSAPGPHIEKIKALGDNEWLKLPETAADPSVKAWGGKSYGRSWSPKAAYAPQLGGAFMTGEGAHSAMDGKTGHYGDDVWFYDLYANRWICLYAGTHIPTFAQKLKDGDLRIDDQGILRDRDGQAIPVCTMTGHAGFLLDYDKAARKFVWSGTTVGWLALPGLKEPYEAALKTQGKKGSERPASGLWMYDVASGKTEWFDKKDRKDAPGKGTCLNYIQYVDSKKQIMISAVRGNQDWWFDVAKHDVHATPWKGEAPPAFPAFGSCYDPKRDRVYVYGSSEYNWPATKPFVPEDHFFYYDVKAEKWVKPRAKNSPSIPGLSWGRFMMEYDTVNDRFILFNITHKMPDNERCIHVYDPEANEFAKPIPVTPQQLPTGLSHSFFCPELNAFFIHRAAGDNQVGQTWVYRHQRALERK